MPLKKLWLEMDSEEFTWHLADYLIEPWGQDWRQTAKICETIAIMGGAKKMTAEDFMPPNRLPRQRGRQMTGKEIMDAIGATVVEVTR